MHVCYQPEDAGPQGKGASGIMPMNKWQPMSPLFFYQSSVKMRLQSRRKDNNNIIAQVTFKASKPYYFNGVMDWPEHQSLWIRQKYTFCYSIRVIITFSAFHLSRASKREEMYNNKNAVFCKTFLRNIAYQKMESDVN